MDTSGLETIARRKKFVQEEEYGTVHSKNVFVLNNIIGLVISVKYSLNAVVGKHIINCLINVSAMENQNGMERSV